MRKKKNKTELLNNLILRFKESKGYVLFSLLGLDALTLNNLRLRVKENSDFIEVPKKTLIYKANPDFPFSDNELREPFGILWLNSNNFSSLKIFKELKEEKEIKILGGVIFQNKYSSQEIWEIVDLPSEEELRAKLVYLLSAPLRKTVFSLNFPLTKLVLTLSAIKK